MHGTIPSCFLSDILPGIFRRPLGRRRHILDFQVVPVHYPVVFGDRVREPVAVVVPNIRNPFVDLLDLLLQLLPVRTELAFILQPSLEKPFTPFKTRSVGHDAGAAIRHGCKHHTHPYPFPRLKTTGWFGISTSRSV
jgi:hypothetical protein